RDLSGVRAPGRSQSPHSTAAVRSREKHGKQSRAEGRWAGRWMRERQDRSTDSTGSARKGYTRCRKLEATTLSVRRSFGVDGAHGVGAGQRRQSGRWYSLMDKVYAPATLQAAWAKV